MSEPWRPRPFQQRVIQHVLGGRSVILQAPTGSGKTDAALAPFSQNLAHRGTTLPPTCRYAVPMRVLTEQFHEKYRDQAEKLDRYGGTHLMRTYKPLEQPAIARQTGDTNEDTRFESIITFCTIDQLLASFIGCPYGLGQGQANLNVAAVAGSYLVLDEFHLYPLQKDGQSVWGARTAALEMLRLLKGLSPFVLMTATFSTKLLGQLQDLLDAEVEDLRDESHNWRTDELQGLLQGRERRWELSPDYLSADAVLAAHPDRGASLVICNTVARAQGLYRDLRMRVGVNGPALGLLHARFTPEDRTAKSEELTGWLGPDAWQDGRLVRGDLPDRGVIVVATQVVEVGLDVSVSALHTEIAPANSLIQRAGRCARFAGQRGLVRIYPLAPKDDGTPASTLPYRRDLCESTWHALEKLGAESGVVMDFTHEQRLIDDVHTDEDAQMLEQFRIQRGEIHRKIFGALGGTERSPRSELIRENLDIPVMIHHNPGAAVTSNPWEWVAFSLNPFSLESKMPILQERQAALNLDWIMKKPELGSDNDASRRDADEQWGIPCEWRVVNTKEQIKGAIRLCLPPQLAAYDSELGFRLLLDDDDRSTGWESTKEGRRGSSRRNPGSWLQSYVEHIDGLARAYEWSVRADLAWLARALEERLGMAPGAIDAGIRLALAMHDLGKLAMDWQKWAHEWQEQVRAQFPDRGYPAPRARAMLAKTDFDNSPEQRKLQRDLRVKRPWHACEGVKLGMGFITQALSGDRALSRAVLTAIARHHTANARTYRRARLAPGAHAELERALTCCGATLPAGALLSQIIDDTGATISSEGQELMKGILIEAHTEQTTDDPEGLVWLSYLVTRALRLCDQRAGKSLG
jgi:CRISPR-associated endonuclease/helicase Cas3